MDKTGFLKKYEKQLSEYEQMSQKTGSRSDYVQGGGGNTSCKLDEQLMAIKASGFQLKQVSAGDGYVVLDYAALREFYNKTDPSGLDDIQKAGASQAASATQTIEGMPQLRPSVEAGFHAVLDKFVLHTHSVYANLASCSAEGRAVVQAALADLPVRHVFIPYTNPGPELTFAINEARQAVYSSSGNMPAVIFMENHGLVVTMESASECLVLNDQVNDRISGSYGLKAADWPDIAINQAGPGFASATSWLRDRLRHSTWDLSFLTQDALYPDQLVYLNGQVHVVEKAGLADTLAAGLLPAYKCTIFRSSGEIFYQCGMREARTMEETICAIFFIKEKIRQAGLTIRTLNQVEKDFITNWDIEKYRRKVSEQT